MLSVIIDINLRSTEVFNFRTAPRLLAWDIYGDSPLLSCPVLQIEAQMYKEKYTRQIGTHCRSSLSLNFSFYFHELMNENFLTFALKQRNIDDKKKIIDLLLVKVIFMYINMEM